MYSVDLPPLPSLPEVEPDEPSMPPSSAPSSTNAHADDPDAAALEAIWYRAKLEMTGLPPMAVDALRGSSLAENGQLAGVPFYRVTLADATTNLDWLNKQASNAVRRTLASFLHHRLEVTFSHPKESHDGP